MTDWEFPPKVLELVDRFELHRESYLRSEYKEARVRAEFVDPFFEELGWDVQNRVGNAEAYKDVIHEDTLKVEGESKAPDYCFRAGTTRKFYVEAKKPAENVKTNAEHAYQLRRYAWNAKLPLSLLTNFRELAVYDCRVEPKKADSSAVARVLYFTADEYRTRWPEIAGRFAKEAVYKGLFDKFADTSKSKRGTTEVDAAFLREIEEWRETLAHNLALRNKALGRRELNHAVQATIDRIIFLRIGEARRIEDYGQLRTIADGKNVYRGLTELFRRADDRYNSGLFHFKRERGRAQRPDELTLSLVIDDRPLKSIIKRLYYPESPYEFAVLPADILGQVYEQFLGKVITLTQGHRAHVEDKPEVKKAGGVYYTPTFIVEYIVRNTLKPLLHGSTPRKATKLRIVDPSCGSGSFLIQVYQYLLDWHLDWYVKDGGDKYKTQVYRDDRNVWRLSTQEKKRILVGNVFGVDIDPQAVETTKLSLLLKVLEGETSESMNAQLTLLHERALPDLDRNIRCGNSLVEPGDVPPQMTLMGSEEAFRLNAFRWEDEFPTIMGGGGFDAIVGNPPYLKIEHIQESDRALFVNKYKTFQRRYDVYGLFIERSIQLLKDGGLFGMIVPSTMLNNLTFSALRKLLLERTSVTEIVNLGGRVFSGVTNDTLILLFSKGARRVTKTAIYDVCVYGSGLASAELVGRKDLVTSAAAPGFEFELRVSDEVDQLVRRMMRGGRRLGDACSCFQGFVTGGNDAYIVDKSTIESNSLEPDVCKPAVFGDCISRYEEPRCDSYVIYLTRATDLSLIPHVAHRLEPYRAVLSQKREVRNKRQPWYALHWPRVQANFELPEKILVQAIRNLSLKRRIVATLDSGQHYADHTLNVLHSKGSDYNLLFVLGVLNSKLTNFVFSRRHIDINIKGVYLTDLPLPALDFNDPADVKKHTRMTELVRSLLDAKARLARVRTDHEREVLEREVLGLDRQVDSLVYKLFDLEESQIFLVEGAVD